MPPVVLNFNVVSRPQPPLDLPVSLTLARHHLTLGTETDRDELLVELIRYARDWVENASRTCLVSTLIEEKFHDFPCGQYPFVLCREPARSIVSVIYTNASGVESTVSSNVYKLESGINPAGIYLKNGRSWPTDVANEPWGIKVRYHAGPPEGEPCRGPFRNAVLALVTFFHENPGYMNRMGRELEIPRAVLSIMSPAMRRGYL
jgi:uncharacterized phiE125 gp8 family phage protein